MNLAKRLPAVLLAISCLHCHTRQQADLIIFHTKIYSVDSTFSMAQAMAVKDGKVLAMGSDEEIRGRYSAPQMVDAGGQYVYPGFIDAHSHFVEYGQSLFTVALFGSASFEEVVQRVKDFAARHPGRAWILGRGWDQNKFPGKAFPDNGLLNQLFPFTPVVLWRVDGHALLANAKALELAGVHAGQTLVGGSIETKNGRLTGLMVDNAEKLIYAKIPAVSASDFAVQVDSGQQRCFAQGLTTITDPGLDRVDIERIDSLQKAGRLKMRMYVMLSDKPDNLDYYIHRGPYKTDLLYVKGVKAYADGALGSRGACLLSPYNDRPGWVGFLLNSPPGWYGLAVVYACHRGFCQPVDPAGIQ